MSLCSHAWFVCPLCCALIGICSCIQYPHPPLGKNGQRKATAGAAKSKSIAVLAGVGVPKSTIGAVREEIDVDGKNVQQEATPGLPKSKAPKIGAVLTKIDDDGLLFSNEAPHDAPHRVAAEVAVITSMATQNVSRLVRTMTPSSSGTPDTHSRTKVALLHNKDGAQSSATERGLMRKEKVPGTAYGEADVAVFGGITFLLVCILCRGICLPSNLSDVFTNSSEAFGAIRRAVGSTSPRRETNSPRSPGSRRSIGRPSVQLPA